MWTHNSTATLVWARSVFKRKRHFQIYLGECGRSLRLKCSIGAIRYYEVFRIRWGLQTCSHLSERSQGPDTQQVQYRLKGYSLLLFTFIPPSLIANFCCFDFQIGKSEVSESSTKKIQTGNSEFQIFSVTHH